MKKTNHLIWMLLTSCILISVSCKKNNENTLPANSGSDCPISEEEIKTVTPPTLGTARLAFEEVVKNDSSLLNDEQALGCAIFNWVKNHPESQLKTTTDWTGVLLRLTWEEWQLLILHPIYTYEASGTLVPAGKAVQTAYPCDEDAEWEDSKADAIRHAYWNILMAKATSLKFAEDWATAHESSEQNKIGPKQMDLHNNKVGRDLLQKYPTAPVEELFKLLTQLKFIYLERPEDPIPTGSEDALIFIKAKRTYDVTMRGILTNPDANTTWDMTLELNQCSTTLRGQYIIQNGMTIQKRRFEGYLYNGSIVLSVFEPYIYENPGGYSFCRDVVLTLSGNENKLSGVWTSSSCTLGGEVDVVK